MSRYVVSDIHGCYKSFSALLFNKLHLEKTDKLYLLGDYINKGPDSKAVLDLILLLWKDGYCIHCIRGNHDQMLLDVNLGNISGSWSHEVQKKITLKSFGVSMPQQVPGIYLDMIASMPLYIELENHFLVHAGFSFGIGDPFLDKVAMMNIKSFSYNKVEMQGKKIIHGHFPQLLSDILVMADQRAEIIKIDAGCVYYTNKEYGNLVALDLDTYEVHVQPNVDLPYEVGKKGN